MFELLGCALVAVFGRSAVLMTGTGWVAGSTDIACELRRCEIAPRAALRGGQTIRPERPNSSTKVCHLSGSVTLSVMPAGWAWCPGVVNGRIIWLTLIALFGATRGW